MYNTSPRETLLFQHCSVLPQHHSGRPYQWYVFYPNTPTFYANNTQSYSNTALIKCVRYIQTDSSVWISIIIRIDHPRRSHFLNDRFQSKNTRKCCRICNKQTERHGKTLWCRKSTTSFVLLKRSSRSLKPQHIPWHCAKLPKLNY